MGNRNTVEGLTEKDRDLLVKLSGKTEVEIQKWYDEFHEETERTDRMDKKQFHSFYKKLKNRSDLDHITEHIFRAFDTDHSGMVNFQEFILAYIATYDEDPRKKFEYAFSVFDVNENDRIEKKEAKKILSILCRIGGLTEEDAKVYTETVMVSFDTNHDKVISREEFINGCLHDPTLARVLDPFKL